MESLQLGYGSRLVAGSMESTAATSTGRPSPEQHCALSSENDVPGVANTQVIGRRQWQHLTAQIHHERLCVAPILVPPVPLTQVILQLSGAMHMGIHKVRQYRSYQTGPGTLYLTVLNQPAYEINWRNLTPEPVRTLHLFLDNDLLAQTAAANAGLNAAKLELRDASCLDDPLPRQLGEALVQELQDPEARSDLYGNTVAHMLTAQLVRRHGAVKAHRSDPGGKLRPGQMRQLHDYIREQLGQPITLSALASSVHLSPYHFCRVFKRTTGQSPNQYVIAQRMAPAAHLLRHTQLTVAHIASEVGYQSVGHFTRLFKQQIGCLPAAYANGICANVFSSTQDSAHRAQDCERSQQKAGAILTQNLGQSRVNINQTRIHENNRPS